MKKNLLTILYLLLFVYNSLLLASDSSTKIFYEVDMTNYQDDLFHVTVFAEGLTEENNIYNLPATVPGTYSNLNFGRFVKTFSAYDNNDNELEVERIGTNQWQIEDADNLKKIIYDIEDTFDANVGTNFVMPMGGTGISEDYIVLNTFGVLGYFDKLQSIPIKLKLDYRSDWTIGTSLTTDEEGYYTAETYDRLADSPILIGNLTAASTYVNDIKVGVYVYSPDTSLNAAAIMEGADRILQSSSAFIGYSPVTHYNFLMCFLDQQTFQEIGFMGAGALEHSYSSLFVFPAFGHMLGQIEDDIAHEFLHILTPLNLHSEIIEPFNFVKPTASEHIWLYEGVTEWASDIMQLRGGLISTEEYLSRISEKISVSEHFRNDQSLTEQSKNVYSETATMEFLNFYNKGAVTAALLDIRLLELSKGTRGLREVFLELIDKYGKNKPFPEADLFNILVDMTYPEIQDLIDDYIIGKKPLPYAEYMAKLGYKYIPAEPSEDTRPTLGINFGMNEKQQLSVIGTDEQMREEGFQNGDAVLKILGEEAKMETAQIIFSKISSMKVGDPVPIVVERNGEEVEITAKLKQRMKKHVFREMDELTEAQKSLRDAWSRNL